MELSSNWNYPTRMHFGSGRINELPQLCKELGITRPLLITDEGLTEVGFVKEILEHCRAQGLGIELFSDVQSNPTGENVEAGVAAYHAGSHDGVIALGGGSGLDAAKAIALMVGQTRPIWDFEDIGDNWLRVDPAGMAKLIAIPTTAGTGSEVGRASVIIDTAEKKKKIIFHPNMLPGVVLADPDLTMGLSAKITAATGMDALSHSLEAFCAPGFHPMADGIAMESMRLIKTWLPIAVAEPSNIDARSYMLVASSMGATAFQKNLGGMHALAHPLGAYYGAHHGLLNAVLMPYVLQYNSDVLDEPLQRLARYLDLQGSDAVLNWILSLRKEVGIPNTLPDAGVEVDDVIAMAQAAVLDPSAGGNPKPLTVDEYAKILRHAISG